MISPEPSADCEPTPSLSDEQSDTEGAEIFDEEVSDPLLKSLQWVANWHGIRMNAEQVLSGLPLLNGRLTPTLLVRAAERMGFRIRIVHRRLRKIPGATLPVILILNGKRAGVLQAEDDGNASFIEADDEAPEGWSVMSAKDLKKNYGGYAVLLRPTHHEEAPESVIDSMETEKGQSHWYWGTIWKFKYELFRLLPVSVLINLFALSMPLYIMSVYDRVVPNSALDTLWVLASGAVIVFTFEYGMRLLRGFLLNRTSKRLDGVLASALFDHLMAMDMKARPLQTGVLAGKARGYEALRDFFTSATMVALVDVPFAVLMIGVIFYLGGWVGWIPTMATAVALTFGLLMQFPLRRAVMRAYREGIERQSFLTETIGGLESIKGSNAQNAYQRRMENMIREASDRGVRAHWYSLLGTSTTTWFIHLTTIALVIGCVYRVSEGSMTLGGVVACVILTSRAMNPLTMVTGLMTRFQQTVSALKGLNQVMNLPREYGGGRNFTVRESFRPDFKLHNVVVRYPEQLMPSLDGVSLHIKPGDRIGIIGPVGSGKSTLLKILVKLYEPEEGEILLDGLDLPQYHPVMLRRHIGYLPQSPSIFHGTLRDNVALGSPWVSDAEVLEAIRIAGLTSFVNHNHLGMHMQVGEQGICLSGGQREAIALARCLLRDPRLLLLDEPTASMDVNTEEEVVANLQQYLKEDPERTMVLATHKLHLLNAVDRVIVLDSGKIVADGPKEEVMNRLKRGESPQHVTKKKLEERKVRKNPERKK